jgi:hypothetical protein
VLGARLLWDFARAVGDRARLINQQRQRALQACPPGSLAPDIRPRGTRPLRAPGTRVLQDTGMTHHFVAHAAPESPAALQAVVGQGP